jgi:hypothetical protein
MVNSETIDFKVVEIPFTLFKEIYCVFRVKTVGKKYPMYLLSIVSRILATDWKQLTSLERLLGTKRFCYVFYNKWGVL